MSDQLWFKLSRPHKGVLQAVVQVDIDWDVWAAKCIERCTYESIVNGQAAWPFVITSSSDGKEAIRT